MFEEIKELILDQLDIEENQITMDSRFVEDFGADSLDLVELSSIVEEKYQISFSKEDRDNITKVSDLIELIKSKKG